MGGLLAKGVRPWAYSYGAVEGLVRGLPLEARDALVVNELLLVMSLMVTHETKCFSQVIVANGEVVEFLKKLESSKVVECIDKFNFLFLLNVVQGLDVFKLSVCLIGSVEGKERVAGLAVCEDRNFQLPIIQKLAK